MKTPGIHHITAITSDAQTNIDFYSSLLGLRLIKVTVNYDDPASYHLYYGDASGKPGSALTFFVWPGAHRGTALSSHVVKTSFAVSEGSLDYWQKRLTEAHVAAEKSGDNALRFADPDGMGLEIIEHETASEFDAWENSSVPKEHALRGFAGATLSTPRLERSAKVLTDTLGLKETDKDTFSFAGSKAFIKLIDRGIHQNFTGAGVVHHIAFRIADDQQQLTLLEKIGNSGLAVSPVMNRSYFHSIYFREPGGVLFEVATDLPGFNKDENDQELGTRLALPEWMESNRSQIEANLPKITLANGKSIP